MKKAKGKLCQILSLMVRQAKKKLLRIDQCFDLTRPTKRQILFPCPIGPAVFLKIHAPSSGDCYPKENNQNNIFLSGCYLVPKWAPKL